MRAINNRFDLDHNLENIVYNELLYMGYELKVFDNNGKEIDFIDSKNGKIYLDRPFNLFGYQYDTERNKKMNMEKKGQRETLKQAKSD